MIGKLPFSRSRSPYHLASSDEAYPVEISHNMRFPYFTKRDLALIRPHLLLNVRQATAQRVKLEVITTTTLLSPLLVTFSLPLHITIKTYLCYFGLNNMLHVPGTSQCKVSSTFDPLCVPDNKFNTHAIRVTFST